MIRHSVREVGPIRIKEDHTVTLCATDWTRIIEALNVHISTLEALSEDSNSFQSLAEYKREIYEIERTLYRIKEQAKI